MIACTCRGASERDVQAAIDGGASCLRDLRRCGIGGDCCSCEETLLTMIEERAEAPCAGCCHASLDEAV